MWPAIICGLIIYKLFKCFFYDDDVSDIEASDSTVLFIVADRFPFLLNLTIFLHQFSILSFNFHLQIQFQCCSIHQSNFDFHFFCRLQKLFGGKVFVGLRIPDADSASPQSIDIVLVTKRYFPSIHDSLLMWLRFKSYNCSSF